jgi:synaptobrevin family protein YKT6
VSGTDKKDEPAWLKSDLSKFQDPAAGDKLTQIQKTLDEVKDVMHKNIDEVLQRGETLDSLMEKSDDLSATSVQFYKKAKKTNACCKY